MAVLKFAGIALAVTIIVALVAHLVSAARFRAEAERLVAAVTDGPETRAAAVPQTVRSFAARNGGGEGTWRALRVEQEAEFRRGNRWGPMPATQHIGLGAPGFVWNARAPGALVPQFTVIDAYAEGKGVLAANLFGSIPVARASGPVIDRSEAMRYLAELPWAPDAILGNPGIVWTEAEDGTVEASLETPSGRVSVRFAFDEAGDIVEMTGMRPDTAPEGEVLLPWRGRFSDYGWLGGRRIPTRGEVGYVEDGTFAPYWRGRIVGAELLR